MDLVLQVGGTLDPETGECHWTDEQLAIPIKKLQKYISAAQKGMFIPDREKDELTVVLGNPENHRRKRGIAGSVLKMATGTKPIGYCLPKPIPTRKS